MSTTDLLLLRCPRKEECGKQFKMYRPAKAGIFKITCPHCGSSFSVNIPASMTAQAGQSQARSEAQAPSQKPDYSAARPIKAEGEYLVGHKYEILCPHCHGIKMGYTPQSTGLKGFRCVACKGVIHIEARQEGDSGQTDEKPEMTHAIKLGGRPDFVKGRIRRTKRFSRGVVYPLPVGGRTVIGRDDPRCPSDFGIRGDSHVSRRSVAIDVDRGDEGYTFKMTVLNATNPVLHNGRQLAAGESIYLNFGDSITLGKTKLIFEKDV